MHREFKSRLSVSVVIPTYNRAAFIATSIDSALRQTRMPDQIVVVDDGSTDDTLEILAKYGPPVTVIRRPNGGESAARNTGVKAVTSDAMIFLDSDDILMPDCIERYATILEEHPEVDVVYSDANVIDTEGRVVARYSRILRGRRPSGRVFGELSRRCFLTVTSMVRRSALAGETFDESLRYCPDYDLWRRLAARCIFHFVDKPLMSYRFHDGMTVGPKDREVQASFIEVQRRFMAMPEFGRLSRSEQARFYCTHGIKNAMLDRVEVARQFWWKAARTCPTYPGAIPLVASSLLGKRLMQFAIVKRRQLAGNKLGTFAGPLAVVRP